MSVQARSKLVAMVTFQPATHGLPRGVRYPGPGTSTWTVNNLLIGRLRCSPWLVGYGRKKKLTNNNNNKETTGTVIPLPHLGRRAPPPDAGSPGDEHAAPSSVLGGGTGAENLVVLVDGDGRRLVHLVAEVPEQSLQGGNVLDLQVVLADAAAQHRVVVELLQKHLEDVGDAQARQEVPLRDGLAHAQRDEVLVPAGRDEVKGGGGSGVRGHVMRLRTISGSSDLSAEQRADTR